MKNYNTAPLPFRGQKRYFLKEYTKVLKEHGENIDTVVDLFGGSGLLSHTAKQVLPGCRVVYNDFDRYTDRLKNIDATNELINQIRPHLSGLRANERLGAGGERRVLEIIETAGKKGFVDYITLSSSLLFSGKFASTFEDLKKQGFYNKLPLRPYAAAGYLDGVETVHMDYRELFARERGKGRTLFVIDPPYMGTDCGTYSECWRMADYLDVLDTLSCEMYIYFTSGKSDIIELCAWLKKRLKNKAPLVGATLYSRKNQGSHNSAYTDIMAVKI